MRLIGRGGDLFPVARLLVAKIRGIVRLPVQGITILSRVLHQALEAGGKLLFLLRRPSPGFPGSPGSNERYDLFPAMRLLIAEIRGIIGLLALGIARFGWSRGHGGNKLHRRMLTRSSSTSLGSVKKRKQRHDVNSF